MIFEAPILKRRRESESMEDEKQVGERRKIKKLKYSRLVEDWGANDSTEEETKD